MDRALKDADTDLDCRYVLANMRGALRMSGICAGVPKVGCGKRRPPGPLRQMWEENMRQETFERGFLGWTCITPKSLYQETKQANTPEFHGFHFSVKKPPKNKQHFPFTLFLQTHTHPQLLSSPPFSSPSLCWIVSFWLFPSHRAALYSPETVHCIKASD